MTVFLLPIFHLLQKLLRKRKYCEFTLRLNREPNQLQKQMTILNIQSLQNRVNQELNPTQIFDLIFRQSFYFFNYGLNIFLEQFTTYTGFQQYYQMIQADRK